MPDDRVVSCGLGRVEEDRLRADLDRALDDKLLAQSDSGARLARELDDAVSLSLPSALDIDHAFETAPTAPAVPSNQDIHSLLSLDTIGEVSVGDMKLNDLLARGGSSLEDNAILKPGLLFLSRRRYPDAVDWWLLKRPADPFTNPRLYCLTTLLLALTYQLSGDTARARETALEASKIRPLV